MCNKNKIIFIIETNTKPNTVFPPVQFGVNICAFLIGQRGLKILKYDFNFVFLIYIYICVYNHGVSILLKLIIIHTRTFIIYFIP